MSDDTSVASADVHVRARNVSKSFNGITVLSEVSFDIHKGEIVALIGQNGSGKSTFIKVLSGFHAPDEGAQIHVGPRDVTHSLHEGPSSTGLAFVHQDLALIESLTILENLRIKQFATGLGRRIRWREEEKEVRRILSIVGLDVSPRTKVADLTVTERALVVIARGLADIESGEGLDSRLLVLDEPTAYLPQSGVERLFDVLRRLSEMGTSVLFVSHRLDEVLAYCTRAVVFRSGEMVADIATEGRTERDLIELMLGRPPEDMYPEYTESEGSTLLAVSNLSGEEVVGASFVGNAGEIVGFIGLPGSGYDKVPYLIAGALRAASGSLEVRGEMLDATSLDSRRAIAKGIALLPADRKGTSGATGLKVIENMTIPTISSFTRLSKFIHHRHERATVDAQIEHFGVKPQRSDVLLSTLSGGNQQKVLIGKWVIGDPSVLALHEPTQGVDVGAKRDVFYHLSALAKKGALVLVSSVEYEDLAHLCTRVHVMAEGRIVRTIERDELNAHDLAVAVYAR
ncbi:MAG TPA: sugar ABC transporter ATP-binding protein [Acidimicrobiales bacterium]|nr:sugar ABC transporter ATP-binding protein [Acidimicrobiales bacterium]